MEFECWSLPGEHFIADFSSTFGQSPHTKLTISPETGAERIRKRNKGFHYTNAALQQALEKIKEHGIKSHVYFSYPLPYETTKDIQATAEFMDEVKKQLGSSGKVFIQDFDYDPASAIYLDPEKFNLKKMVGSIHDFCDFSGTRKFQPQGYTESDLKKNYAPLVTRSLIYDRLVLAQRALNSGRVEEAIHTTKEVLDFFPFEMEAILTLGLAYEKTQRLEDALQLYQTAERIFPLDAALLLSTARAQFQNGQFQASLKTSEKVLEIGSKEGNIHFLRGLCYEKTNSIERAIQELRLAEEISPNEAAINFSLGRCYKKAGNTSEMLIQIEKGMKKSNPQTKIV
jgi:tetratricopeptide (TPR) repeat protein